MDNKPFQLVIPTETVFLGEQAVEYRGLNFDDISLLLNEFDEDVDKAFSILQENKEAQPEELAGKILEDLPKLVCAGLAMAAGHPDSAAEFRRAPAAFQLASLEALWNLTVEPAGGAKKFFERVASLLGSIRKVNQVV